MYLSAQRVFLGAATLVSVSSDIPPFNGEWRLFPEVHLPQRGLE